MVLSLTPEPGASVVAYATADTSVVNSTVETALATLAIPKTVKAGDVLLLDLAGDLLNNSGGTVNYIWKVKIGATSALVSPSQGVSNSSFRRQWHCQVKVIVAAVTDQRVFGRIHAGQAGSTSWQVASIGMEGYGSAAEDLSAGKNVQLTATLGTAAATADMVLHAAALTHIRSA